MSNYLCCAACLHAIRDDHASVLVDGYWYHDEHAPRQPFPAWH